MPLLSFSGRHMYVIFIFECPPLGLQFKRQFSSNKLALTYLKQCKTTFLKVFCKFWNWLFVKDKNYKIRKMYHVGPLLFNCCCCCCFYNLSFPRNHSDRVQDQVTFTFLRIEKYHFYAIKILLEHWQQSFLLKISGCALSVEILFFTEDSCCTNETASTYRKNKLKKCIVGRPGYHFLIGPRSHMLKTLSICYRFWTWTI